MGDPGRKISGQSVGGDDALLIAYLSDRDTACPLCKYNLRGLTHPRCPECGQALRLTVGTVDAFSRAWVTTVAALCVAAGVGIVCLLLLLLEGWPRFSSSWMRFCVCVPLVSIPAALAAIFLRRKFLRLAKSWQWFIAGIAIVLIPIGVLLLLTF